MPYVPAPAEARRLQRAIDRAALGETERILWLLSFLSLVAVDLILLAGGYTWLGALGSIFGFFVLYWRLRAVWLFGRDPAGSEPPALYSLDLRSREQRAFTALMLRQAVTGRNTLAARPEHDPFGEFGAVRVPQAGDESSA